MPGACTPSSFVISTSGCVITRSPETTKALAVAGPPNGASYGRDGQI
jgi:hypothetical protein